MGAIPTIAQVGNEVGLGRLRVLGLRMRVWWAKDRLTRELAGGAASIDSRELALRAGQLTARSTREVVASAIEELLGEADRPAAVLTSRVPIDRSKVFAVRHELEALAERVASGQPVRPQGMALALLLLTDPEKPMFGVGTETDLADAIIESRERLDAPPRGEGS